MTFGHRIAPGHARDLVHSIHHAGAWSTRCLSSLRGCRGIGGLRQDGGAYRTQHFPKCPLVQKVPVSEIVQPKQGCVECVPGILSADDMFRSICFHSGNEVREKHDNLRFGHMTTTARLACVAGSHTPVETFQFGFGISADGPQHLGLVVRCGCDRCHDADSQRRGPDSGAHSAPAANQCPPFGQSTAFTTS